MVRTALFTAATHDGGGAHLNPGQRAMSAWGPDHMRGMAVCGALAREAECAVNILGRSDLTPVRWSIDLFRPTRMSVVDISATIVRNGRRYCLIDVAAQQNGQTTARATAAFAVANDQPTRLWNSDDSIAPPPSDGDDQPDDVERFYWDEDRGWLEPGTSVYSPGRKAVWHFAIPVVSGEEPSGFVTTAAVSDVVNAVASIGPDGLAFINTDATMHLSRSPVGTGVGLVLNNRTEHSGLSAASAVVFDRRGPFGVITASGLAQPPIAVLGHPLPPSDQLVETAPANTDFAETADPNAVP